MKTVTMAFFILFMAVSARADVEIGYTYEDVVAELGLPEGFIKTETDMWLTYDRGTVKLTDNCVVAASLVSPEEALLRREQEEAERAFRQRVIAEQNAQRIEEGRILKASRVSDPAFLSLPASDQVAYWQKFRVHYPEISVRAEYELALSRYEEEVEQMRQNQEQEQRIAELEARIQLAEARADRVVRVQYYYPTRVVYPTVVSTCTTPQPVVKCRTTRPVYTPACSDPYAKINAFSGGSGSRIYLAGNVSF